MKKVLVTTRSKNEAYGTGGGAGAGVAISTILVEFPTEEEAQRAVTRINAQHVGVYTQIALLLN